MDSTIRLSIIVLAVMLLVACGGGGGSGGSRATAPGAPTTLTVNAGDGALSIGWLPPIDNGGAAISGYEVDVSPPVAAADIHIAGTRAIIGNLTNGTSYTLAVAARNAQGAGPASTAVSARPEPASGATYSLVTISGDPGGAASGFYDPALLRASNSDLWLAYSAVNFYTNGSGKVVQDVGTRVARSTDNGISFDWIASVAAPVAATVTDTYPGNPVCGSATCSGRWVYETATLVEDTTDPDPDRRFKLLAHKYFLYPDTGSSKTVYPLGAIVMWTASSPDAAWSGEQVLIGWARTPPELPAAINGNALDPALAACQVLGEPGAAVYDGDLLLAVTCPYDDGGTTVQKIVLLRSRDHAATFEYVSTLLTPDDAPPGIDHFSAPSLIARDDVAPVLLATPVIGGQYGGTMVFPLAATGSNDLFRLPTRAVAILWSPVQATGHIGGASTYARDTGTLGILQSDAIWATAQFRIVASHAMIEQ